MKFPYLDTVLKSVLSSVIFVIFSEFSLPTIWY